MRAAGSKVHPGRVATLVLGGQVPSTIFTHNKNLEYLKAANHLNPHQALLALFFNRFHFTPGYCPGSLSHIHLPSNADSLPESFLPLSCFIRAITWECDQEITNTLPYHVPATYSCGCTYLPPQPQGNSKPGHTQCWQLVIQVPHTPTKV